MSENVSRLERLRSVRQWLAWQLRRTDEAIAVAEREDAARAARRTPPPPPDWVLELGIGNGPPSIHAGECFGVKLGSARVRAISRDEARCALVDGASACGLCRPDSDLGMS
ncbi:DUF6233 domain-containing protein [Streptomyces sp. NPDC002659]|uniref:DUF6233 domain-containing protein n=1 Tax=Streptomyces sp. NPDC002659 TaxID=3364656 RepID=UPI0036A7E3D9